jgi:hypothetical protein
MIKNNLAFRETAMQRSLRNKVLTVMGYIAAVLGLLVSVADVLPPSVLIRGASLS